MAGNPVDPLQSLQAALAVPANSKEQADILATLRESLETHPAPIPLLLNTFLSFVVNAGDSLLKRWVIDILHFGICRSTLSMDQRTQMASQALDTLAQLIDDSNPSIVKVVIQCMTAVYPLLFRLLCTNRNDPATWNTLSACKSRIIEFVWSPQIPTGMRLSAMKFLQRVILVQTRGISDPRLQNKNDPHLAFCPADHPFISVAKLEAEGQKLLEGVISTLYTSQDADLLSALLNSWAVFTKLRPGMIHIVVSALKQWTPVTLSNLSASAVKSVEKAIRILLMHISRGPGNAQYVPQISEALAQQASRMDKASVEERKRKMALAENRKRPATSFDEGSSDSKRPKLEQEPASINTGASLLATFDFTTLPANLITDLIVANIEAFTEPTLINLVGTYRQTRGLKISPPTGPSSSHKQPKVMATPMGRELEQAATSSSNAGATTTPAAVPAVKDEPVDPLQMDIDQDELEYEPERLNQELSGDVPTAEGDVISLGVDSLQLIDFKLPPPKELADEEQIDLVTSSISRIWEGAEELKLSGEIIPAESSQAGGNSAMEIWMLLLVRMITRVAEPLTTDGDDVMNGLPQEDGQEVQKFYARQDQLRQKLCDWIMSDFPARIRLATTWMNEEWYNDQIRLANDRNWRPNYDIWLNQIVVSYQTLLDGKDRTFSRFLLDLPTVPADVLDLLRDLCVDFDSPGRMQVGFTTLRGLVVQRPSMRVDALNVLLELTTHSEKKTRGAAINTVKLWVPNTQPMDGMIREFALQMLRKLQLTPDAHKKKHVVDDNQENMQEHGPAAPPRRPQIKKTWKMGNFRLMIFYCLLCPSKSLSFLMSYAYFPRIFAAYGQMDITVQEAIQELITALIRSLGSNHGKLLTLMRTCPPGAESLALRRPSAQLVALVKALVSERDLDARFLIPIIAEMDKPDIMRHLPRIVSLLNGQAEHKNLVRSVFSSIVTTPPQTFGSVSSNLPRSRQVNFTPAELMVLLHDSEKEIGLKSAIEAIGICFSMTDIFRSEVLAVVMQQIIDEPVLPVLFLRTVIQAVTTYKSLVAFVSTTLLSRLITKKIWTNPPLWEGFIRCAKVIAPASFGALLQLPKDQLRELVDKQPGLRAGLREHVMRRATNRARVAGFLDILGDSEDLGAMNISPPSPPPEIEPPLST
ncbi:Symplekin tight junction protein C terminal-domain-containing protein [Infundibulicybe gibba]|nr:Symplekin tight junction protein C terminal-domain-containing protein [Infundibulicybe gibba]